MGFNTRYFNQEMLVSRHIKDRENGIGNAIGRTDSFVYQDSISCDVIDLWMKNRKEEARKILDTCILNHSLGLHK